MKNKVLIFALIIILIGLCVYLFINFKNKKQNRMGITNTETNSNQTVDNLKFDNPDSNNDISNDPVGPFYHKVYKALSADGLDFSQSNELVLDKASVPDAVESSDGNIYVYAVDGAGRSNSGAMVAVSNDNGKSWKQGSVQIKSDDNHQMCADPQAIILEDGSIRLFYLVVTGLPNKKNGQQINNNQGTFSIKSAISKDGINFVEEKGDRYQSVGEMITDPDVIKIDNKWYMYLSKGPELIVTSSDDGETFEFLQSIRQNGSVSKTVPLGNNQFRQYFCSNGISSAISTDGLNWTDESGIRIEQDSGETVCDPSPVKIDSGWLMFYKTAPAQRMSQPQ